MLSRRSAFGILAAVAPAIVWAGVLFAAWSRHDPDRASPPPQPPGPPDLLEVDMNGVRLAIPMLQGFHVTLADGGRSRRNLSFNEWTDFGQVSDGDGVKAQEISVVFGLSARSPYDPYSRLREHSEAQKVSFPLITMSLSGFRGYAFADISYSTPLPPNFPADEWGITAVNDYQRAEIGSETAQYEASCGPPSVPGGRRICHYSARHARSALGLHSMFVSSTLDRATLAHAIHLTHAAASMLLRDHVQTRSEQ